MSFPGTSGSMHNPANDKSLVARPDDYDGAEAKYQVWKRQVRIFLHAHQTRLTTDEDKILLVASYMKIGKAQRWVQPIIDEILDGKTRTPPLTITLFWTLADAVFLPPALQANAALALDRLTQGKMTTEAYFTEFDIFAQQAGYDAVDFDTMKIRTVNRSLNKSLVANIHNTTTLPTTWDTYKTRATQLDNNWHISQSACIDTPSSTPNIKRSNNPFRPFVSNRCTRCESSNDFISRHEDRRRPASALPRRRLFLLQDAWSYESTMPHPRCQECCQRRSLPFLPSI